MAISVVDSYQDAPDGTNYVSVKSIVGHGVNFTTSKAYTITFGAFLLWKAPGSTPGETTVHVSAVDGDGHPTGDDLCSGIIDISDLGEDSPGDWKLVDFGAGASLNNATQYAMYCTNGDANYYLNLDGKAVGAGGNRLQSISGTWYNCATMAGYCTNSINFKTYETTSTHFTQSILEQGAGSGSGLVLVDKFNGVKLSFKNRIIDAITLVDSLNIISRFKKALSDTISLVESISIKSVFKKVLSDAISLVESFGYKFPRHSEHILDRVTLVETFSTTRNFIVSILNSISLGENLSIKSAFKNVLSDLVALNERFSSTVHFSKAFSDSISLVETFSAGVRQYIITILDSISLTEKPLVFASKSTIHFLESISLAEIFNIRSNAWSWLKKNVASWTFNSKSADPTWNWQNKL